MVWKLAKILASLLIVLATILTFGQVRVYPAKKPTPTEIYPQVLVFADEVVEQQWAASLELVNGPRDLQQLEPGQCIRLAVLANGDDRDRLLAATTIGLDLSFAGQNQTIALEPPAAIKKGKPEGGDFVSEALGTAGIQNPALSMVTIAASRARWCVPPDAHDGVLRIQATTKSNDKSLALKPRQVDVKTFETARKTHPFKDMDTLGSWLQKYHAGPDPANLLPGLRIVAADEKAKGLPNIMMFFIEALKSSPLGGQDVLRLLPSEDRAVRVYCIPLLAAAGYTVDPLLDEFKENERTAMASFRMIDPFDLTPDQNLPYRMDMLWAQFFATGRIEPVRKVASMLAWRSDYDKLIAMKKSGEKQSEATESMMRGVGYTGAGWSLNALSRSDSLVADYVDALRASSSTPANVKEELGNLHTNPAFTRP
jgi:hypothetical protein